MCSPLKLLPCFALTDCSWNGFQGFESISLRFWSMLTSSHHIIAANLSSASSTLRHPIKRCTKWRYSGAVEVQRTHCHANETSLIWLVLCDIMMKLQHCIHKAMRHYSYRLWNSNDTRFTNGPMSAKYTFPTVLHHPHQPVATSHTRFMLIHAVDAKYWSSHLHGTVLFFVVTLEWKS